MSFFYNLFVYLYTFAIKIAAPFNDKAKLWVKGRENIFDRLQKSVKKDDKIIWVHVASLGEFEQARPVIEKLKKEYPRHKILLTFFSPSGYEIRKNYDKADMVFYLPADTKENAKKFIKTVNPQLAIFVKYEFWFNYIDVLYKKKIPLIMISVIFRPSQHFFKFWGRWFRRQLRKVTWFFVQNEDSLDLLAKIKIYHAYKSGDTRFDRVYQMVKENKAIPEIENFKCNSKLMIAGSTWPPDEEILHHVLSKSPINFKIVIAPHEVDKNHITNILNKFKEFSPVLYSGFDESAAEKSRILIIDTTGILGYVYRYAEFSYVGGGFGAGIHNLLEPVTYGQPVIFGPNYHKFREAHELIEQGCGFPVNDKNQTLEVINRFLADETLLKELSLKAKKFVESNIGATGIIMEKINEFLVVTNSNSQTKL